jgi:hypothetical protein
MGLPAMHADTVGRAPGESPKERADRELHELLEEIRVALPGVELLFGFLLILPFSERFEVLDAFQRGVYIACFVVTTASSALYITPTAEHRLGFRKVDKERMVRRAGRQVLVALALLACAISLAAFLVGSVVLGNTAAGVIGGLAALWFFGLWFVVPKLRLDRDGEARRR